jgi:hypothetical protein
MITQKEIYTLAPQSLSPQFAKENSDFLIVRLLTKINPLLLLPTLQAWEGVKISLS